MQRSMVWRWQPVQEDGSRSGLVDGAQDARDRGRVERNPATALTWNVRGHLRQPCLTGHWRHGCPPSEPERWHVAISGEILRVVASDVEDQIGLVARVGHDVALIVPVALRATVRLLARICPALKVERGTGRFGNRVRSDVDGKGAG